MNKVLQNKNKPKGNLYLYVPVSLPQRDSKFPLSPLTRLHNDISNGYWLNSSLSSKIDDAGIQAGPEYPSEHLKET